VVVAEEQSRVRSFQEKPRPDGAQSTATTTCIYIFEPALLDLVPSSLSVDIGSELFPLLVERDLPSLLRSASLTGSISDAYPTIRWCCNGVAR